MVESLGPPSRPRRNTYSNVRPGWTDRPKKLFRVYTDPSLTRQPLLESTGPRLLRHRRRWPDFLERSDMSLPRTAGVVSPFPAVATQSYVGPSPSAASGPKILLYSHDTVGLGNVRRSIVLGELFLDMYPDAAVLLITGSPMIHAYRIPRRMDYVKLPCLTRVGADRYEPRFLDDCVHEVRRTRTQIIERTIAGFAPDLVIV